MKASSVGAQYLCGTRIRLKSVESDSLPSSAIVASSTETYWLRLGVSLGSSMKALTHAKSLMWRQHQQSFNVYRLSCPASGGHSRLAGNCGWQRGINGEAIPAYQREARGIGGGSSINRHSMAKAWPQLILAVMATQLKTASGSQRGESSWRRHCHHQA
jgi:hypothetical protein